MTTQHHLTLTAWKGYSRNAAHLSWYWVKRRKTRSGVFLFVSLVGCIINEYIDLRPDNGCRGCPWELIIPPRCVGAPLIGLMPASLQLCLLYELTQQFIRLHSAFNPRCLIINLTNCHGWSCSKYAGEYFMPRRPLSLGTLICLGLDSCGHTNSPKSQVTLCHFVLSSFTSRTERSLWSISFLMLILCKRYYVRPVRYILGFK